MTWTFILPVATFYPTTYFFFCFCFFHSWSKETQQSIKLLSTSRNHTQTNLSPISIPLPHMESISLNLSHFPFIFLSLTKNFFCQCWHLFLRLPPANFAFQIFQSQIIQLLVCMCVCTRMCVFIEGYRYRYATDVCWLTAHIPCSPINFCDLTSQRLNRHKICVVSQLQEVFSWSYKPQ